MIEEAPKKKCVLCGFESNQISSSIKVCVECLRKNPKEALIFSRRSRERWRYSIGFPIAPPRGGKRCHFCVNECEIPPNGVGFCGVVKNIGEKLTPMIGSFDRAYLRWYLDPHPTNCVALPVCPEKDRFGFYNLAVFLSGCNLDCFFCQNIDHKYMLSEGETREGEIVSVEQLVSVAEQKRVSCVCYFGGDPIPWSPLLLNASKKMSKRICWETNGLMGETMAERMALISLKSGGIVKIDWKAFTPSVYEALTGVDGERAVERLKKNVRIVSSLNDRKDPPLLVVSTLVVPHYVDEVEVGKIAHFLAQIDENTPYVLLAFAPQHLMHDVPTTSKEQMKKAFDAATSAGLKRVYIGNVWLLR